MTESFARKHFRHSEQGRDFLINLERRISWYKKEKLADRHFESQLYGSDEYVFYERLWELNLAEILTRNGLSIESRDIGPDFLAVIDGTKYWFEAISPSPMNIPDDFLHPPTDPSKIQARDYPHKEILLRITSAIRDKSKKFIEYLNNGVIDDNDACIIAIDTLKLGFEACIGISQHPVVVEATYPVGPIALSIDRATGRIVDQYQSYRSHITKQTKSGDAQISTELFLTNDNKHISAVLCSSGALINPSIYTVHNYLANTPLTQRILLSEGEYVPSVKDGHLFLEDISHHNKQQTTTQE